MKYDNPCLYHDWRIFYDGNTYISTWYCTKCRITEVFSKEE